MGVRGAAWPVPPRPGQAEVSERLADSIAAGHRVLFSAPTGWGKTIAVLAAIVLTRSLPVLWLVRSLALGKRIAEDAALWKLAAFIAGGRERACLLYEELGEAVHDFCKFTRYKCPYARLPPSPPLATNYEELVERGGREGWCPYLAQDLVEAHVVVQSYYRRLRAARVTVIDEAHNLLIPREREISLSSLADAVAALRQSGVSEKLVHSVVQLLGYAAVRDGSINVEVFISEEGREELWQLYYSALSESPELARRVKPLLTLLRAVAVVEGEKIRAYEPQAPFLSKFKPSIFVTATPPPFALEILRVDVEVKVPPAVRPRAQVVDEVTTKFEEFDSKMALRYRRILIEFSRTYRRVLVFAASERVARELRPLTAHYEVEPPEDWEGVVLFRARGRYSEGVDIPSECVLLAGAPYLPPEVSDRLAGVYKQLGLKDAARAAIDSPMIAVTLQCIGRAWRNPSKPPFVVLADTRFKRYEKELSHCLELA